ncbi:MAG TPA: glycosyltransferase 87 family protein [Thermoanaerobaculia bacterium]|nr:glycosyltransferase 87 family protein [Thermoanaerobaculia bacterium]
MRSNRARWRRRGEWLVLCLATVAATVAAGQVLKDLWIRILLAACGTALALLARRSRAASTWYLPSLAVLALAALVHTAGGDFRRFVTSDWVRGWNTYHYYLGPKYFGEVGYFDLYRASLVADQQLGGLWQTVPKARDQHTYAVLPREAAIGGYRPEEHFSPARWQEFQQDIQALGPTLPLRKWRTVFRDRGYNATPFWSVAVSPLARLLPPTSPAAFKLLTALDLLLLAWAFWALAKSFGPATALWVLFFFALTPVNQGRLVGGILQYDWFSAMALGLAWLSRRRAIPAALALAFASLARVFPVLLVFSVLLPAAWRAWRRRRLERHLVVFALGFGLAMALGVGIGCLSPRGPAAWGEFAAKIRIHTAQHVFGEQRVGLKHAFTQDLGEPKPKTEVAARKQNFLEQTGLYWGLAGLLVLGWLAAVLFRRERQAWLLGLVPVYALTVASRYYWSSLALLGAWGGRRPASGLARRLNLGQSLLLLAFYLASLRIPGAWARYNLLNWLIALLMILWLAASLYRDGRLWRRLRGSAPDKVKTA